MKLLPYIVIVALIAIIFFQRSCVNPKVTPTVIKTEVKIDTFYDTHTDTVASYVPIPKFILRHDTTYKISDDVQELRSQLVECLGKYYERKIYEDSLKIDSIGYVKINDTISQNNIAGRSYISNYKIPVITKNILITEQTPPKRQVYLGGELVAGGQSFVQGAYLGVLFKNKKDQIFGLKGGLDINGQPLVGVSSYWKIKFHK
jgi:hypothetical protein